MQSHENFGHLLSITEPWNILDTILLGLESLGLLDIISLPQDPLLVYTLY